MGKKEKEAPETRKVRILDAAFEDLEEITEFIATQNQQLLNAIRVAETIGKQLIRLKKGLLLTRNARRFLYETIPESSLFIMANYLQKLLQQKITIPGIIHQQEIHQKSKL